MPALRRIDSSTGPVALFGVASTRLIEGRAAALLEPHALMRRAGAATARLALALAPHARRFWVAAGPGNNGGDGFEAALCLRQDGRRADVMLVGTPDRLPADAKDAFERARAGGIEFATPPEGLAASDLAIDALLGIGGSRSPEGAIAEAVRQLNDLRCPVLAVDVPSGLSADTGQAFGTDAVVAAHTLSLLTLKPGLFTGAGRDHAGSVWLDTLEVELAAQHAPDAWLRGVGNAFDSPGRRHASHKGTFGDVAVVGGADGMGGAAVLAARAAHAAGAGRVYVALLNGRRSVGSDHDPMRPELMFRADWSESPPAVLARTTVVCGCGGGDAIRTPLPRLVSLAAQLVLDADALNAISSDRGLRTALLSRATRHLPTIMTPHPLEASRLLDSSTREVQRDRLGTARELAERYGCVAVLKGSGTVVAAPNAIPTINATGDASLASAGTGDVLAGWIGGLWAQMPQHDPYEVAVRAVAEHGAAAEPLRDGPMRAADLVEALHARLRAAR